MCLGEVAGRVSLKRQAVSERLVANKIGRTWIELTLNKTNPDMEVEVDGCLLQARKKRTPPVPSRQ